MNVQDQVVTDRYAAYHGDSCEVLKGFPSDSIDFSIYSPPFSSLYTYSASERDVGNVRNDGEFFRHFAFIVAELYRVLKPGRLMAVHCMDLPTSKERDGYIGLKDFRGDLIRAYQAAGFILHSQVTIWKDPVTAMQRTKAYGLLHKTIRKDSSMSRQGIPDYLVVMRKPGTNPDPIPHTVESFPVERWQRYASPVWAVITGADDEGMATLGPDIDPSGTLQHRSAREDNDERHIAPLQLEIIRRAVRLWTNPDDVVLTPFGGIGSEGVVALEEGRRAALVELKASYYQQQVRNLAAVARKQDSQLDMFASIGAAE